MIAMLQKSLSFFWPKTLERQFLTVLIVVLMLAQFINLALLVGERQIVSRSSVYNQTLDITASKVEEVSQGILFDLPYEWAIDVDIPGAYFLTEEAPLGVVPNTIKQERLERQLSSLLESKNLEVSSFQILLQTDGLDPNINMPTPPGRLGGPPGGLGGPAGGAMGGMGGPPMGGPPISYVPESFALGSFDPESFDPESFNPADYGPPGMAMGPPRGLGNLDEAGLSDIRDEPFQFPIGPPNNSGNTDENIEELLISVEVEPGLWLYALVPFSPVEPITWRMAIATASLMLLTLCAAILFFRKISKPLTELTHAADRLGRGDSSATIDESGPDDIRKAAIAFNAMQRRLSRTLETQRTMLHAVGHDLRTPLTALRIRAERVKDTENKEALISSIDEMSVMTQEILSWAEDMSGGEDLASVNLTSLVESLCDDYTDQGLPVSFKASSALSAQVRRVALKRALRNLIDNALKYGHAAHISIENTVGFIVVNIDDEGPGIADSDIKKAFQPFVRLETSRSKATGGTGLGLSIAKSIIQADGGKLELSNRPEKGLRARISIPA